MAYAICSVNVTHPNTPALKVLLQREKAKGILSFPGHSPQDPHCVSDRLRAEPVGSR